MGYYEFHKDLDISTISEHATMKILPFLEDFEDMISVTKSKGKNHRYDFEVIFKDGSILWIEQKEDFKCSKTGNIAIELESWGKLSGISITHSPLYLEKIHLPHYYGDKIVYFFILTDVLKYLIKKRKYYRISYNGGDTGSNTKNYLFPWRIIKDYGHIVYEEAK